MNKKIINSFLPLCSSLAVLPTHAGLYDALEEVYVTAQKTTQSTQDIGIAVSAFTGEAVKDLGLDNPMDLAVVTPGLSTANALSDSIPIFSIRGVGLDDFNANNSGGVGVYVDDVFVTSPAMMSFQMFDIERVEVLKGPQGTLYGRNTTGGAINFISKKPSSEYEATLTADYSRFDKIDISGAVSGPFSNDLRGRIAVNYIDQGEGTKEDIVSGDDMGTSEKWTVRGLLDWTASDSTEIMFNLHAGADKSEPTPWQSDDTFGLGGAGGFLNALSGGAITYDIASPASTSGDTNKVALDGVGFSNIGGPSGPERDDDFFGGSVTITTMLDDMEFVSITAYDDYSRNSAEFYDGSPVALNDTWFQNDIDSISQEFRLSSDASDDYNWILGISYGIDNVESEDNGVITEALDALYLLPPAFGGLGLPYAFTPNAAGLSATVTNRHEQETTAAGLFGQIEFFLSDEYTLTVGARYTNEKREFEGGTVDNEGFVSGVPGLLLASLDDEESEENFSGKLGFNWAPNDDLLVYVSAATGFKSGVFYGSAVADQAGMGYVEPEEIVALEVGFKATLADGKVRLNGAAYQYYYDDKQMLVTINTAAGPAATLTNAPEAEIDGVELELWTSPIDGVTIQLTSSYIHGKLTEEITDVRGSSVFGGSVPEGERLSLAPKWSYSALARYDWNIGNDLTAYAQTDYSWQDNISSLVADPNGAIPTNSTLGARIAIASADEDWEVAVWGRNLEGNDDINYAYSNFLADRSYSTQHPRTYGISATYNW